MSHITLTRFSSGLLLAVSVLVLTACGSVGREKRVSYEPEEFDSTTTHTRVYKASESQTCEAARRALLSQGYMITAANADLVTGRKSFQPAPEVHVEVEFRTVCARDAGKNKGSTIAFVTALQDRYGLKKVNNSASLGVGAIGSLSLPFSSSDDAMVKIASETLTDERFYDRFFSLMDRFLVGEEPAPEPLVIPPVGVSVPTPVQTFPVLSSPDRG